MRYNKRDSTGPVVWGLGMGTMTFAARGPFQAMGNAGQPEAHAISERALGAGVTPVDPAGDSSGGESERIVAQRSGRVA